MDSDIQFGDVQEAIPEKSLRPDRNAHYAVAPYESPQEDELPVFLDLDVLLDMEAHAQSDKTVELGGVLLGGQYHDQDGKPFVVITDSLRAKHYESTKGSFKFTHDTWTDINQQRNEYPPDLQMVGWYHTHPDWGVFLSGMDMFICDHFFNRPLDVAYVIDPCRGDRAFFQWTGNPRERVRRTRGYYIMASRYREAELAWCVTQLTGSPDMPSDLRNSGFPGMMAPVVNVSQPQPQPYQGLALLGMLTIQACLLMLIAWRMFAPPEPPAALGNKELTKLIERLDEYDEREELRLRMDAQRQVLDKVLKGTAASELEQRIVQTQALQQSYDRQRAMTEDLSKSLDDTKLLHKQSVAEYKSRVTNLEKEVDALKTENTSKTKKLAELTDAKKKTAKGTADDEATDYKWYVIGAILAVVVVIGGLAATLTYKTPGESDTPAPRQPPSGDPPSRRAPAPTPAPERVPDQPDAR